MPTSPINTGGFESQVMPALQLQNPALYGGGGAALGEGIQNSVQVMGALQKQREEAAMAPLQQQLTQEQAHRLAIMTPLEAQEAQNMLAQPNLIHQGDTLELRPRKPNQPVFDQAKYAQALANGSSPEEAKFMSTTIAPQDVDQVKVGHYINAATKEAVDIPEIFKSAEQVKEENALAQMNAARVLGFQGQYLRGQGINALDLAKAANEPTVGELNTAKTNQIATLTPSMQAKNEGAANESNATADALNAGQRAQQKIVNIGSKEQPEWRYLDTATGTVLPGLAPTPKTNESLMDQLNARLDTLSGEGAGGAGGLPNIGASIPTAAKPSTKTWPGTTARSTTQTATQTNRPNVAVQGRFDKLPPNDQAGLRWALQHPEKPTAATYLALKGFSSATDQDGLRALLFSPTTQ